MFILNYARYGFKTCLKQDQSEGTLERINEPPWARCRQGAVDARWVVVCCLLFVVVVVVVVAPQGHFGLIVLRHTASLFCHP